MRLILLSVALFSGLVFPSQAEELRPPLEKQFFDYFAGECKGALETQAKAQGKRLDQGNVAEGIANFCACTSQAIVSHLNAGEIIAFATNPEAEPGASKLSPHFEKCKGK